MKRPDDLKLIIKLAIPTLLLVAVTAGLIMLARSNLTMLDQNTQHIVDVSANRLVTALGLAKTVDEATIREKNIIIETDDARMAAQHEGYKEARQTAYADIDRLIAMADTPERRATNEGIKRLIDEFFTASEKAVALGLKNDHDAATRISNTAGRAARGKLVEAVTERVAGNQRDLAAAKENASAVAASATQTLTLVAVLGLIGAVGVLAAIAVLGITRPLVAVTGAMDRLASGDLDVAVLGTERKDEVGSLARSLQLFKENAIEARHLAAAREMENEAKMRRANVLDDLTKRFERSVSVLTQGLAGAATEMEATARSMTETADETTQQTMAVAGASQQTSANVQTVAAASEEMAASVQEICIRSASRLRSPTWRSRRPSIRTRPCSVWPAQPSGSAVPCRSSPPSRRRRTCWR